VESREALRGGLYSQRNVIPSPSLALFLGFHGDCWSGRYRAHARPQTGNFSWSWVSKCGRSEHAISKRGWILRDVSVWIWMALPLMASNLHIQSAGSSDRTLYRNCKLANRPAIRKSRWKTLIVHVVHHRDSYCP
jgi:hypothetical protein